MEHQTNVERKRKEVYLAREDSVVVYHYFEGEEHIALKRFVEMAEEPAPLLTHGELAVLATQVYRAIQ